MRIKPFLSIIVPLYNEELRLAKAITIFNYLKSKKFTSEIIFVNDGSLDKTAHKLKQTLNKERFLLISYKKNRGKGYAIRKGMIASSGKYRLFIDIDLSTPIEQFDKFLPYLKENAILIGSRRKRGSNINKHQSLFREILGRIFTFLSKTFLMLSISDFTCGFKCFPENSIKEIFYRQRVNRWGFDPEIIFLANKFGYKIKEIPIVWVNDPLTKVKFPQDVLRSFFDLVKIRLNDISGKYRKLESKKFI